VIFEKLTIVEDTPVQKLIALEPNGEPVTALYNQAKTG
jgi:hypothetical protein